MAEKRYLSTDPNWGNSVDAEASAQAQSSADAEPSANTGQQVLSAAALAARPGANAIVDVATNPNIPKMAAKAGRIIGATAPVVGGAMTGGAAGGPTGAVGGGMVGATQAAKGAWIGGRTGWFTGKLAQDLLMPVAKVATKIAPYLETMGMIAGASGVYDLVPMRQKFEADWSKFQADYPKTIGKERWNALTPKQRDDALHVFMKSLAPQKGAE